MWSSRPLITRRAALCGAAAALAGCGFVPAYGSLGAGNRLRNEVAVSDARTVADVRLRERLSDRLGPPGDTPAYRLDVDLSIRQEGVAITQEGAVTRFTLVGAARFALIRQADGVEVVAGNADGFTGYSTTDSTVATEDARIDAEARLAVILADQIVMQLLARVA